MRHAIFDHWKLKLLALMLAAIAWVVSIGRDYTLAQDIKVILTLEPPAGGVILQINGAPYDGELDIEVDLSGPRGKIDDLEVESLTATYSFAYIDVDEIKNEPRSETVDLLKSIRIRTGNNNLPPDIEIDRAEPEELEVKIDRITSRAVRVKPILDYIANDGSRMQIESKSTDKGCVDGYRITDYSSNPAAVTVSGPASVMRDIEQVTAGPALVDQLYAPSDRTVSVVPFVEHPIYGRVGIDCQKRVEIKITVEEKLESRTLKDVPIRFLMLPKYFWIVEITKIDGKAADAQNPTVDIVISGPAKQLAGIKPEDLTVFLDLTQAKTPGEFETTPGVKLPVGIRLDRGPEKPPPVPVVTYEVTSPVDLSDAPEG
ncbi:MAG: hypothetical protein HQ592_08105 [Planctomycetes bacterium]|nr:hypothetical protein [Planctomycetota bacterium]